MDNSQIPLVQVQPAQPMQSGAAVNIEPLTGGAMPYSKPRSQAPVVVLGILVVILIGVAGVLSWLLISKNMDYQELSENVDLKIAQAVDEAKTEQAMADAEEAKKDTRQFTGPTDYGQLSFDFPKLWSVYVASDASKGGDYVAYLNPLEIEPVSESTVYALRVTIRNKDLESVTAEYQRYLGKGDLSMDVVTVGGTTANRYTGKIPGTELNGIIVTFGIRDKTVVLRTDALGYEKDFLAVLNTVKFNP